ncbi:MAG: DNA primase [Syntrophales bacterium LBB04]|nr:DNA primase [Syntrophales bacterium LBB04]
MKGLIPGDKIEEIKTKADIVELVSEYVTLKKAGRNFLGLCPFHKEKTPSFTVSRDKQMFYCFGCGEGGHVFTFLMKMSNMTFPEAARYLARKTGTVIPDRAMTDEERQQYGIREQINRVNEAAMECFGKTLFSPTGTGAREYLKKRGIKEDVVREFRLGFADEGWRTLRDYFSRKKVPLAVVSQAGLIVAKTEGDGDFYDRFRGRLIFPIEDVSGRVIAFGGRIIGAGEPKYLNSPETPVFSKGRNLYGLNRAKENIRKSGYAILVEGYFDLISLWNVGIDNCVATMGTALTKEQVELLRRYTGHVVALFDPDEAGRKALEKSLLLFLTGGLQAKAVVLPEGYDPDDYVRKFGGASLREIIAQAPSLVDYYIENIVGKRATLEEKRDAVKEAMAFVSNLDDAIEKNLFFKRIAEKLGIDEDVLKREARRTQAVPLVPLPKEVKRNMGADVDKVEFSLILFMLEHPETIVSVGETGVLDYFIDADLKNLGEDMLGAFNNNPEGQFRVPLFLDCIDNGPLKEKIIKSLFEEKDDDEKVAKRYLSDTIRRIKQKWFQRKSRNLKMELDKAQEQGDQNLCSRLLQEKDRLKKEEKLIL